LCGSAEARLGATQSPITIENDGKKNVLFTLDMVYYKGKQHTTAPAPRI
jgi:hypothetical protein